MAVVEKVVVVLYINITVNSSIVFARKEMIGILDFVAQEQRRGDDNKSKGSHNIHFACCYCSGVRELVKLEARVRQARRRRVHQGNAIRKSTFISYYLYI